MRTIPRASEEQTPVQDRSSYWRKPEPQWRRDEAGRRVRVYECLYCRDMGLIVLPRYKPGETDEHLCGIRKSELGHIIAGVLDGPGFVCFCPNCRGHEASYSTRRTLTDQRYLSQQQRDRMARWYRRKKQYLETQAAEDARERMPAANLPGIAKPMPALSGFAQDEIAAELRAAKEE